MTNDLSQLRDIHLPQDVSFIPLALGWWLVLALLILISTLPFFIKFGKKIYKKSLRLKALKELEALTKKYSYDNSQETITLLARLIKRIALISYDKQQIAKLHSSTWADFLIKTGFDDKNLAEVISNAPYLDATSFKQITTNCDMDNFFVTTKKWIIQNIC